jgi:iron complex transport system permease protein
MTSLSDRVSLFSWRSPLGLGLGLGITLGVMVLFGLMSVLLGAADIQASTVYAALFNFDGSTDHLIIRTVRLPRTLVAMSVGACLSVAGAITQGLTRNPLAAPDILGINAGAALTLVITILILGSVPAHFYVAFAFIGGAIAAIVVWLLGTVGSRTTSPLRLILAGAALTALMSSFTTAILLLSQRTLEEVRFWLAGSVAGRGFDVILPVFPYMAVGLSLALCLGKPLTALTLGEEIAIGLGLRVEWIKRLAIVLVVLLASCAVALAGPVGFIGLVVPHLVRMVIGGDYRWLLPYSATVGASLLVMADIGARLVIKPQELPVGIMTALVGAPFFVYLAQRKVKG